MPAGAGSRLCIMGTCATQQKGEALEREEWRGTALPARQLVRESGMNRPRQLNRRSFFESVVGAVLVGGGALVTVSSPATAHPISDNDLSDRTGRGRGRTLWPYSDTDQTDSPGRASRLGHYTDSDAIWSDVKDASSHGRRITDHDRHDPTNYRPTITDTDSGQFADLAGRGRRPRRSRSRSR